MTFCKGTKGKLKRCNAWPLKTDVKDKEETFSVSVEEKWGKVWGKHALGPLHSSCWGHKEGPPMALSGTYLGQLSLLSNKCPHISPSVPLGLFLRKQEMYPIISLSFLFFMLFGRQKSTITSALFALLKTGELIGFLLQRSFPYPLEGFQKPASLPISQ